MRPSKFVALSVMGGTLEGSSFPSSKRRRRNDDYPKLSTLSSSQRKKHLYLALDDWKGGYSIHRLDADDILDQDSGGGGGGGENKLPKPAALRIALPGGGPMGFAAVGTNIFVAINRRRRGDRAPPTLVYDTKTAAVTTGPCIPDWIHDLGDAMAVGETLYALTTVPFHMLSSCSLEALSWVPTVILDRQAWDPTTEWCCVLEYGALAAPVQWNGHNRLRGASGWAHHFHIRRHQYLHLGHQQRSVEGAWRLGIALQRPSLL